MSGVDLDADPTYADFMRLRPMFMASNHVSDRVTSLLSTYQCFYHCALQKNVRTHRQRQRHVEPRKSLDCVDHTTSSITDTLNKINESNYMRMQERITSSVELMTKWETLIRNILVKCFEQDFYIFVYIRLLQDILQQLKQEQQCSAEIIISYFVTDAMKLDLATSLPICQGKEGYDRMCERMKAKKHLVGRARTCIQLIDRGMVSCTRDEFFGAIMRGLDRFQCADDYVDDYVDICLEYVREFMKSLKSRTLARMTRLRSLMTVGTCGEVKNSIMCRCKMQDIVSLPIAPEDLAPMEQEIWQSTSQLRRHLRLPESKPCDWKQDLTNPKRCVATKRSSVQAVCTRQVDHAAKHSPQHQGL